LVEEGDIIDIDIEAGRLQLMVDDNELQARRDKWSPRPPRVTKGYLAKYAGRVTSASTGAVTIK